MPDTFPVTHVTVMQAGPPSHLPPGTRGDQ